MLSEKDEAEWIEGLELDAVWEWVIMVASWVAGEEEGMVFSDRRPWGGG